MQSVCREDVVRQLIKELVKCTKSADQEKRIHMQTKWKAKKCAHIYIRSRDVILSIFKKIISTNVFACCPKRFDITVFSFSLFSTKPFLSSNQPVMMPVVQIN